MRNASNIVNKHAVEESSMHPSGGMERKWMDPTLAGVCVEKGDGISQLFCMY